MIRSIIDEQLTAGIPIAETLVRLHLVSSGDGADKRQVLLLLGDHLAFDGRSFVAWLGDLMSALSGQAELGEPQAFADWTERLPELNLKPLAIDTKPSVTVAPSGPGLPADGEAPPVRDMVVAVPAARFAALKAAGKAKGLSLNAPLMTAFAVAVAEAAGGREEATTVRGLCAADVRHQLTPPLPRDSVNSAAGMATFTVNAPPHGCDDEAGALWAAAAASTEQLMKDLAAFEAFRLQDIVRRAAYAEMGPLFAVPFIWSNIGHFGAPGVAGVEVHVRGAGSNPLLSAHCVEANQHLTLTLSFSPAFHTEEAMRPIADRFLELVELLAGE